MYNIITLYILYLIIVTTVDFGDLKYYRLDIKTAIAIIVLLISNIPRVLLKSFLCDYESLYTKFILDDCMYMCMWFINLKLNLLCWKV